MGISIDKKAARYGRWGLGIPRNIRKGSVKYYELWNRSRRRYFLMVDRDPGPAQDLLKNKILSALAGAKADGLLATVRSVSDYLPRKLMLQYKLSSIFKRPWIAAQLRHHLAKYKKSRRKLREILKLMQKKRTVLLDLYVAGSILQLVLRARKHRYGIYSDIMPAWYKHVLQREMPAIVRKKMLLLSKGYKINFNPSDFGSTVAFSPGMPGVTTRRLYNKLIANNADPFIPGMLYGAKNYDGITAFLRGSDIWFTPHRDVALGYAGDRLRSYTITLNPEALAVAGYRSNGKPLFTPHIAGDIYDQKIRSSILRGTYTEGRTAGQAGWGDRPDYLAVAYLKPFREGAKNWRNTGLFRVFTKSKKSGTGWLLIQPILIRDKYEHLKWD